MLNCNMMTRSLHCISTKASDLSTYDGLSEIDTFLDNFAWEVPDEQHFKALNWVLRDTPTRWWDMHRRCSED